MLISYPDVPQRPQIKDDLERARAEYQEARVQILDEDHEEVVHDWMEGIVLPEVLEHWGPPDIANNPLSAYANQLTTPGRYWSRPVALHAEAPGEAEGLIGARGLMVRSGYWTAMQRQEFLAVGMGDAFFHVSISPRKTLVFRPVENHNLVLAFDSNEPNRIIGLRERWLHWVVQEKQWRWVWRVYDISDPEHPSYRILDATRTDEESGRPEDVSGLLLERPDGTYGPLEGADYLDAYSDEEGAPYIPYVRHRSANVPGWNLWELRGLHRASLRLATYATYVGRSALDATAPSGILHDVQVGADTRPSEGVHPASAGAPVRQIGITPGMIIMGTVTGEKPGYIALGTSEALPALFAFMKGYSADLLRSRGLGGADAQKMAANPTSGTALHISDKQRREFSEKVDPLFREADLSAIRMAALMCNRWLGASFPTSGYAIVYKRPPPSPQEDAADRDRQAWELEHRFRSHVDVIVERNPGITREDALALAARVRAEEAEIQRLTEKYLGELHPNGEEEEDGDQLPALQQGRGRRADGGDAEARRTREESGGSEG